MPQSHVFYPLFVMFILTLLVGMRMLQLRIRAVYQDKLNPGYFKLNRGGKPPAYMVQTEQHYANLYETPVLFYVIVIMIYLLGLVNLFTLSLAWAYVLSRFGHAVEHMGKNRIIQRRRVFLIGLVVLCTLWMYTLVQMLTGHAGAGLLAGG